jgi:hypothetical protein
MEDAFPPNQPAESEYPAVADEEEDEEEEEEEHAEAPPVVVAAAAKKRGRPAGSKNRAPDVYTALLDRMTQLEETLTRRPPPPSSTGGTPEDPSPAVATKAKRQARPRRVAVEAPPPATSQVDLLMDQIQKSREERRLRQLDFYRPFLPR